MAREKRAILTRTEKWPLVLSEEQERLIMRVSDGLREYYNWALEQEKVAYEAYKAEKKARPDQKPESKGTLTEFDLYTLYKDTLRPEDEGAGLWRANIPANWVLETFRAVSGGYKSFFSLVKRGDKDARSPGEVPEWLFQAIPGALNAGSRKGSRIVLAPQIFPDMLQFAIPEYQMTQLGRASRLSKFIIKREKRDLRRKSRFTLSISYEIEQPGEQPFVPEQAAFIALGASSIGVVSPFGEKTISLWRPDLHWKPRTDAVGGNAKALVKNGKVRKGSRKHRDLQHAFRTMFDLLANQQTLDRREVVAGSLIHREKEVPLSKKERRFRRKHGKSLEDGTRTVATGHGLHFVVTELVVRSKEGKLADGDNPSRGGPLGPNWQAQNTGALAYLVQQLTNKAKERGGSVRRFPLDASFLAFGMGDEKKILIARALRDQFLKNPDRATVL